MATVLVGDRSAGSGRCRQFKWGNYCAVFIRMFSPLFLSLLYSNVVWMVSDFSLSKVLLPYSNCCFTSDITVCDFLGFRVGGAVWQEVTQVGQLSFGPNFGAKHSS